jgi:hypothetical protein
MHLLQETMLQQYNKAVQIAPFPAIKGVIIKTKQK